MILFRALPSIAAGVLFLGACSSAPRTAPAPKPLNGLAMTSLPAQDLAPGECGLFLWSSQPPRNLIFFRKAGAPTADSVLSGIEVPLKLRKEGGRVFGQFLTETDYETDRGDTVRVTLVPGDMIEDGQRTQSAEILMQSKGGWETIVPASGLSACIPLEPTAG